MTAIRSDDKLSVPDLERLLSLAARDTSGSRRIAQFILSLWDGTRYKADLQDLLGLDERLFSELLALMQVLHARHMQLDCLVTYHQLLPIIRMWGAPSTS